VMLFDQAATAGADYDGSAPAESLGVLLQPVSPLEHIHAILLAGAGPMALGASAGVVRFLEENKIGYDWGVPNVRIPIVVGAAIDDLSIGDGRIRVGPDEAYRACQSASAAAVTEGSVGAGAGATVGKLGGIAEHTGYPAGRRLPMKAGIGTASIALPNGLVVAAIVAVNAVGDIIDPDSGKVVAGGRNPDGTLGDARKLLRGGARIEPPRAGENTTIGLVATNAKLSKAQATRMALMADDGYARAIYPSHTTGDGDTIFSLATGRWSGDADITTVGALAAETMAQAIVRAATQATGLPNIPAARDLRK